MFENHTQQPNGDSTSVLRSTEDRGSNQTLPAVIWRYHWAFCSAVVASLAVGFWVNHQKPTTYRATTQLMFKSDTPLSLDSDTGAIRGGVPSGSLMHSLISSDTIVGRVASDPNIESIESLASLTRAQLKSRIRRGIKFQSDTTAKDSRDRLIASIHFDGHNAKVCAAMVSAVSSAIDDHFRCERESAINQFADLITDAQDRLLPQQSELEDQYRAFRETAKLEWDPKGNAINPHRQRQVRLQAFRDQLEEQQRALDCELRFATEMQQRHQNPVLVARMIGQLSHVIDERHWMRSQRHHVSPADDDLQLQKMEVEKSLVPLQIQREQLELAYGARHPEVKSIATQIGSSIEKLNEINEQMAARRRELAENEESADAMNNGDPIRVANAKRAVTAYLLGLNARMGVVEDDLAAVGTQIAAEKAAADELKRTEAMDASFRRRIASVQGMLIELEQQLSSLDVAEIGGGINVESLRATGQAVATGPSLKKDLAVFGMFGIGIGVLLTLILESAARSFRSSDEIQDTLRLPVITHIPIDPSEAKAFTEGSRLSVVDRPYSPTAEAVRGLRTAMLLDHRQHDGRVFQITSPLPGDGKSTIAANLGCSLAQSGKRTLVIDLDLRSPRLSLRFNLQTTQGLANVLNGELEPIDAVHRTAIENLDVLPCGPLPSNPAEALTLVELAEIFAWARKHYDFVIVDTPPLLMVSDPTVVSTHVDAAILVMRITRRCKPNAKEAAAMMRWSGTRLMGVVVNKLPNGKRWNAYKRSASGSYQSIGYGYGDKYRRRYQKEVDANDNYIIKGRGADHRVDTVPTGQPALGYGAPQHLRPRTKSR